MGKEVKKSFCSSNWPEVKPSNEYRVGFTKSTQGMTVLKTSDTLNINPIMICIIISVRSLHRLLVCMNFHVILGFLRCIWSFSPSGYNDYTTINFKEFTKPELGVFFRWNTLDINWPEALSSHQHVSSTGWIWTTFVGKKQIAVQQFPVTELAFYHSPRIGLRSEN